MSWYKRVPKDPLENLKFRRYLLAAVKLSPSRRAAVKEACREDILFYVNTFVWTFDPRTPESAIPFITYPFQDDAILEIQSAIEEQRSLVMQKSRDMGASWISCVVMDHQAQYQRGKRFLMLSYTADLVDKRGSPKSLFWKIDFIHERLPNFLRPNVERRILGIEYKDSNSTVDGATTTDRSGIGDRATAAFIDEFSRFEASDASQVKSGLADVTRCRIWNFTPNPTMGKAHPSYDLVRQAERGDIDTLRMHWSVHPEKAKGLYRVDRNTGVLEVLDKTYQFPPDYPFQLDRTFEYHSPWFDKERRERGNDRDVAEQLEIDYDQSSHLVFDATLIRDYTLQFCRPPLLQGDLVYDEAAKPQRFEVSPNGMIKLWTQLDHRFRPPIAKYVTGTDISLGVGATNSCFVAGRCDTGEKILEVATPHMDPNDFAVLCVAICRWLSNAEHETLLCWERQGPGETFGLRVIRLGYFKVYFRKDDNNLGGKVSKTPGWYPNGGNKQALLLNYQSALSKRRVKNPSKEAMDETLSWINTPKGPEHKNNQNRNNDPSGATVNHGDRVIADALFAKMVIEHGGGTAESQERRRPAIGSVAWVMEQEARERAAEEDLYPEVA